MLKKRKGSLDITVGEILPGGRNQPPLHQFASQLSLSIPSTPGSQSAISRAQTVPLFDVMEASPALSLRSLPANHRQGAELSDGLGIIPENDDSSRVTSLYQSDDSLSDADTVVHVDLSDDSSSTRRGRAPSITESLPPSRLFRSQPSMTSLVPHSTSTRDSSPTSTISRMSMRSFFTGPEAAMGITNPVFSAEDAGELELEYRVKPSAPESDAEVEVSQEETSFDDVDLEEKTPLPDLQDTFPDAYGKDELSEEETENLLNTARDEDDLEQLEWDVFREIIPDGEHKMFENFFRTGVKVLKVIFIVIAFLVILSSLVVSKVGLLYATSSINKYVGFRKYGGDRKYDFHRTFNESCGAPVCYEKSPDHPVDYKYRDMIRWLWCIMLCLCLPYLLTFLQCLFKIMFKRKKRPKKRAFIFVLVIEILHSFGIFCLLFLVLPNLDVMRAIFLMNATLAVPSFLKLLVRPKNHNDAIDIQDNGGFVVMDLIAFLCQMSAPVLWLVMSINKFQSHDKCGYESCDCTNRSIHNVCTASGMGASTLSHMFPHKSAPHPEVYNTNDTTGIFTTQAMTTVIPRFYPINVTQIGPLPECICDPNVYMIPLGLILVSLTHWENFVDHNLRLGGLARALCMIRQEVKTGRTKIYAIVSFAKIVITFGLLFAYVAVDLNDTYTSTAADRIKMLFNRTSFQYHKVANNQSFDIDDDWLAVFGFAAVGALLCYLTTVLSIQANVQRSTFSLATTLATPVSIAFALWICSDCRGSWDLSRSMNVNVELYWNCHGGYETLETMVQHRYITLLGLAWWVGQMLLVRYIWSPHSERLAKSKRIFVQPLYCGVFLEQSLTLNRCRDDLESAQESELPAYVDLTNEKESDDDPYELETELRYSVEPLYERQDLSRPMVFVCVTMWHEREAEMIPLLKSILRLDRDQCAKRLTRDYFKVRVPDYYDFEVHIFFDDAFESHSLDSNDFKVGPFVQTLLTAIQDAARSVHGIYVEIEDPAKQVTPYGGKLIYTLPGGNTITVHMKDIVKIRHRKRWSQVMYLYYLLGFRLWGTNAVKNTKELIANNTYILTLDGDIDFQPESVLHLVDLMIRDIKVGAACGRIHPKGSGPMVWYQKFEYAISHWLQKSAEHVLGCVLCSPGCFSLFRASALMDDNVMKKYSNRAQEAVQYVQYDQGTGEDRWLCTLLLQQGYKVEYSAAADAVTFAPEGFNEFFNQRRRWTPSTFANILDLLTHGMTTVRNNESINVLYIAYQWGLFASSVLGPGTIVLMIAGAFEVALGMSALGSFFLVMTPLIVFFILAFFAKPSIQLTFAAILSALFCVAQVVVLVGIILEIVGEGICSPTSMFMIFIVGIFFISALLHPMEFTNILHGIIYYLAIPTMYLILIIYSLVNLNNVSWGTREITKTKTEEEQDMQKKLQSQVAQVKKTRNTFGLASFFGGLASLSGLGGGDVDGWTWSCGHCCRMMCCPRPGQSATDARITGLSAQTSALHNELATLRHTIKTLHDILPTTAITEGGGKRAEDIQVKPHNPDTYIRDSDSENEDEMDNLLDAALKPLEMPHPAPQFLPPPPMFPQTAPLGMTYIPGGIPVQPYPMGVPIGFEHMGSTPTSPMQGPDGAGAQKRISIGEKTGPEHSPDGAAVKSGPPPPEVVRLPSVFAPLKQDDPPWVHDKDLGKGKIKPIHKKEKNFWEDLITRYLYPLIHDKIHQEKVAKHLRELRNKAVIGFFMVDVLFIVLLQAISVANDNVASETSGGIMIRWNCSDPISGTIRPQLLEPTGLAFIIVFGIFLAVQFVAMLFHRLFSLVQIVSTTTLFPKKDQRSANVADMVNLTKDMAKLEEDSLNSSYTDDDEPFDSERDRKRSETIDTNMGPGKSTIIGRIESDMRKNTFKTMEGAFARHLVALHEIANTPHGTLQGRKFNHDIETGHEGRVARKVSNATHSWVNTSNAEFLSNIQLKNNKARPAIPSELKHPARHPSSASQLKQLDRMNSSMSRANRGTFKGSSKGTAGRSKGTFRGTFGKHDKAIVNVIKRKSTILDDARAKSIRAKHNLTLRDVEQAKKGMAKMVNVAVAAAADGPFNEEDESTKI